MQAIGMVETMGLIAAIESADQMLKSANVKLIGKTYVGDGIVTIIVEGDVAAVKASVDAGASAVRALNAEDLLSTHIIPRPDQKIHSVFQEDCCLMESQEENLTNNMKDTENVFLSFPNKNNLDDLLKAVDQGKYLELLSVLTVTKLKNLVAECFEEKDLEEKPISKMNKNELIDLLILYTKK